MFFKHSDKSDLIYPNQIKRGEPSTIDKNDGNWSSELIELEVQNEVRDEAVIGAGPHRRLCKLSPDHFPPPYTQDECVCVCVLI